MIGGYDLTFDIQLEPGLALDLVCDAAQRLWPDCVVEDSEQRRPLTRYLYSFELSGVSEIMIFKNQAFREMWRAQGATSETEDSMIYALFGGGELTLAVCNPDKGDVKSIVTAVQRRLHDPLFHETHPIEDVR